MKNKTEKQIITLNDGKFYTWAGTFEVGERFEDANKQRIMLKDDGKLYVMFNGVYCPYDVEFEIIEPETESEEDIAKRELNQAIYAVLATKFKKDAYEAHELVKNAGYEIEKWDGKFHIRNRETNRLICIATNRWGDKVGINHNPWTKNAKLTENFDYVACLNKPLNETYWRMRQDEAWYRSKSRENFEKLHRAKWGVDYHTRSLQKAEEALERAMEQYEKDVKYHKECLKVDQESLAKVRAELGLAS